MAELQGTPIEHSESVSLKGKIVDDWVKTLACNHVVVDISTKSAKKNASYCVLCGELVNNADVAGRESLKTVDDLRLDDDISKSNLTRLMSIDSTRSPKHHTLKKQPSSSSLLSATSNVSLNKSCSIHSNKNVKYFCEDHQEIGCSVCINVLHRGCERIMFIKDEIQGSDWTENVCHDTVAALDAISKGFKTILEYSASCREKVKTQILEFRKTRDEIRARLEHLLDEFERKSEKQIKKLMDSLEIELSTNENNCKAIINEAEQNNEVLKETLNANSPNNTFIMTQKILQQRERYGMSLSDAIKHSQDISIDLIPEADITSIAEIRRIGKINISCHANNFPESVISAVSKLPKSDLRSPRTARDARSESSSSLNSQTSFVGKYGVRLENDKKVCDNVGVIFLHDGRVAVIDMNNKNIKMFDSKFNNLSSLELSSKPRGITAVSPQEIAITLPDESKIQLVSTIKKLQTTRSILTALPCYGVTCHNQELIVLCNDGFKRTSIQFLDLNGKILKTLKTNQSGKSRSLKNPLNIVLSVDGQQICITDGNRLVNFDMNGEIIFEYTDKDLNGASGIAVDESGRYYVCGTGSNNVHRISADGAKRSVILTDDDVVAPQSICYQTGTRSLLVTQANNDSLFLFKISKS
ncbi:hypothetical protein ACF0H5_006061 [Mactra antiquata]